MSNLTKEQVKEAYAKAIEVLFGGIVQQVALICDNLSKIRHFKP